MRDSAGVTIVANPAHGTWTDAARWRLEESLRIGTVEGDSEYEFGDVTGIGVAADGRIVVCDAGADAKVRVYTRDGGFSHAFGMPGVGPGELGGSAGPLFLSPADTIYVPDWENQRTNVYTVDGGFVRSQRAAFGEFQITLLQLTPAGRLVFQLHRTPMPGREPTPGQDVITAFRPGGTALDTLMVFPAGETFGFSGQRAELDFFAPEPWWTTGADGALWWGVSSEYRLWRFANGEPTQIVQRDVTPTETTEQDRENVIHGLAQLFAGLFGQPVAETAQQMRAMASFRDVLPAFQQLAASGDGTLWVQQVQPPGTWTQDQIASFDPDAGFGGLTWDVFDGEGRYLGALDMPDRFDPILFTPDHVYGVWRDELDVQYVQVLDIVKP
jgi:hypothetical protein